MVHIYRLYIQHGIYTYVNIRVCDFNDLILVIPLPPSLIGRQIKSTSISLTWAHDPVCFEDYTFSFTISWCTFENGVPDVSTCNSTTTSTTDITLSNLVPNTTYQVNITAHSVENRTIRSDAVEMNVTTFSEFQYFIIRIKGIYVPSMMAYIFKSLFCNDFYVHGQMQSVTSADNCKSSSSSSLFIQECMYVYMHYS